MPYVSTEKSLGRFNMADSGADVLQDSKQENTRSEEGKESKSDALEVQDPVGTDRPNVAPGEVMSLKECCRDAFGKMTEYLRGELAGKVEPRIIEVNTSFTSMPVIKIYKHVFLGAR